MFRLINVRPSEMSEVRRAAEPRLFEEIDGVRQRRFRQLPLERHEVEFFTLHWTVVHPINQASPLRGITPERLRDAEAEFLVLVTGHDETFSTRSRRGPPTSGTKCGGTRSSPACSPPRPTTR